MLHRSITVEDLGFRLSKFCQLNALFAKSVFTSAIAYRQFEVWIILCFGCFETSRYDNRSISFYVLLNDLPKFVTKDVELLSHNLTINRFSRILWCDLFFFDHLRDFFLT